MYIGSAALTAGVTVIGAYVRLKESGLSMIDWKLLGGRLPKTEQAWISEFEKYKKTPEYEKVHHNISLQEYKAIFFREWFHRMAGRSAGVLHIAGAIALAATGALKPGALLLLLGTSGLGLAQAFVGKWMVQTGFEEPTTLNKTPRYFY
ncbi:bifunctional COX15-CtaA family/Heme A synthase [Babesia duncani]|uniref:Bifunctional COX15-CtaA family/Heme A synthase n=1 Tax=Babesia duncani TaxID=323732 RepID=A0AAD9UNI1_9APIC|nr:bifunctional COX15-CtaA family/Heme A synthase [Babesia duncani]